GWPGRGRGRGAVLLDREDGASGDDERDQDEQPSEHTRWLIEERLGGDVVDEGGDGKQQDEHERRREPRETVARDRRRGRRTGQAREQRGLRDDQGAATRHREAEE